MPQVVKAPLWQSGTIQHSTEVVTHDRSVEWLPSLGGEHQIGGVPLVCRRAALFNLPTPVLLKLLVQGVSPRVVMDVLGHSQIALTMNTYTHVIPEMKRHAADRMDELISERDP